MKKLIGFILLGSLLLLLPVCGSNTSEVATTVDVESDTLESTTAEATEGEAIETESPEATENVAAETTTTAFTTKVSSLEEDYTAVISENAEFSDLSIASIDEESSSCSIQIDEDDQRIGFFYIGKEDDGSINSILVWWSTSGIVGSQYKKLMASAFMLGDNSLSYSDASELADELGNMILFGGEAIEKNGITYTCSKSDDLEMVCCAMMDTEKMNAVKGD